MFRPEFPIGRARDRTSGLSLLFVCLFVRNRFLHMANGSKLGFQNFLILFQIDGFVFGRMRAMGLAISCSTHGFWLSFNISFGARPLLAVVMNIYPKLNTCQGLKNGSTKA